MMIPTPAHSTPAPGEPSLALPRTFWKDFSREHWDRKPALFRGLFASHFPTLEEIFAALVEGSERALRGEFPPLRGMRFFIEHEDGPGGMPYYSLLFNLTAHHLPSREDRDAHAYVERVTRVLGGKRFGVVLNRAQCWHWGHWLQMRSFLAGFHQTLGMPLGASDSAVFFGNYRYTPFGIHKDELHVFYFVIEGKKTLSLWPFEALSQREEVPKDPGFIHRAGGLQVRDAAEEQRLLSQASFLEGRAGDLLYWPASYWHRAEPSEGLSVSASLGVGMGPPEFTMMGAPGEWPARLRPSELPGARRWQPPAPLRKALQQHARRPQVHALERERTTEWARLLTSGTLDGAAPEAHEAPLTPSEWIRASPRRPLLGLPLPGGPFLVSANGHAQVLEPSPTARRRLEHLLETLNGGKPQQVEALARDFFHRMTGRAFPPRAFHALLDALVRWRAVERCEPPSSRRR